MIWSSPTSVQESRLLSLYTVCHDTQCICKSSHLQDTTLTYCMALRVKTARQPFPGLSFKAWWTEVHLAVWYCRRVQELTTPSIYILAVNTHTGCLETETWQSVLSWRSLAFPKYKQLCKWYLHRRTVSKLSSPCTDENNTDLLIITSRFQANVIIVNKIYVALAL